MPVAELAELDSSNCCLISFLCRYQVFPASSGVLHSLDFPAAFASASVICLFFMNVSILREEHIEHVVRIWPLDGSCIK